MKRSLAMCRQCDITAGIVERRLTRTISSDFLGIIDIIGVRGIHTYGIQTTSRDCRVAHIKTFVEKSDSVEEWCFEDHRYLLLWTWRKLRGRWLASEDIIRWLPKIGVTVNCHPAAKVIADASFFQPRELPLLRSNRSKVNAADSD